MSDTQAPAWPDTPTRHPIGLTGPAHPASVRLLRAVAAKHLTGWGIDAASVESAEVVISELLTNSLLHGAAAVLVLRLAIRDGQLRIEVDDPDHDRLPRLKPAGDGESGNGMRIVDRLATWGFTCGRGKTVYADIPLGAGGGE